MSLPPRRGLTANEMLAQADKLVPSIRPRQAMGLLGEVPEFLVIDVREAHEYASAHIGRAINIPRGQIEFHIEEAAPDPDLPILLVCRAGGRGLLAARTLQSMGYTHVLCLAGGMEAWRHARLPVETDVEGDLAGLDSVGD